MHSNSKGRAGEELTEVDSPRVLAADLETIGGATFGDTLVETIPPFLGPLLSASGLTRILDSSAFDNNVMLITRFRSAKRTRIPS
jgi:hypothetical protein